MMRALLCGIGIHKWTDFTESGETQDSIVYSRACKCCPASEEHHERFFIDRWQPTPTARCDECGEPIDSILCCQNQHA